MNARNLTRTGESCSVLNKVIRLFCHIFQKPSLDTEAKMLDEVRKIFEE